MNAHDLDARHLLCPLPVIRTQDAVKNLAPGAILRVHCTDPGAIHDIPAWCRIHGHEVLDIQQEGRDIRITLRVGSD
ncbi:MAG: sulfurtransferase TusA family protein [Gammaproteobacteria bacterium]|nr:MAG: sulfurtransferase TusA family protein [Gammaproteobacteria bacterium]